MKFCTSPLFLLALLFVPFGCSPYSVEPPAVNEHSMTDRFAGDADAPEQRVEFSSRWWDEFQDPELSALMDQTLSANLSLKAAFARLDQALARAAIAGAAQYPSFDVQAGGSRARIDAAVPFTQQGIQPLGIRYQNDFFVRSGLSWELDLWKRIESSRTAEALRAEASARELQETGLVLSGTATELWFSAQEQKALLDLINEQIEVSKTFLELIELRFSVGTATALDVLQQRSQLASIKTELPRIAEEYEVTLNQLAAVLALPSRERIPYEIAGVLPDLPPFPKLATPAALLINRPDLRAALRQSEAAEYDTAAAVAERFPQLGLSFDYNFSTIDITELFLTKFGAFGAQVSQPILDGGRRQAQVELQEARAEELLLLLQDSYLTALREVEDALSQERNRRERLERVSEQLELARSTLRESRSRYVNGLSDYLDVIVAVQSVQELERAEITQKRNLLVARARLYRALGGGGFSVEDPRARETLEEVA